MFVAEPLIERLGALLAPEDPAGTIEPRVMKGAIDRKRLRILLDAFMEQAIENIVGEKPLNLAHARTIIRNAIGTVPTSFDRRLLSALDEVLAGSHVMLTYVGSGDARVELERFLGGTLCQLLVAVCKHPDFARLGVTRDKLKSRLKARAAE